MRLSNEINAIIVVVMISLGLLCAAASVYSIHRSSREEVRHIGQLLRSERMTQLEDLVSNAFSVLETANFYEPAQRAIGDMRFGEKKSNYFFVFDTAGLFWVHPAQPDLVGRVHPNLSDAEGRPFIERIIAAAQEEGTGFIEYKERRPEDGRLITKLARFKYFEKWRWILCTGISIDDIDQLVAQKEDEIAAGLRSQVVTILTIILVVSLLSILFSALLIRRRIVKPILAITDTAERIGLGDFSTNLKVNSSLEINQLALAIRRMQSSLAYAIERLRKKNPPSRRGEAIQQPV